MRISLTNTKSWRELSFPSGPSVLKTRRPNINSRTQRCAGMLDTTTFLPLDMDPVSDNFKSFPDPVNYLTSSSDDIYRQDNRGLVCVFSLKNPAHPEYVCEAASGVMCLDFHPKHPHMLVAGLYDGNVAVYNLQSSLIRPLNIAPMYESDAAGGKHMETCWQVRWIDDDLDNYLNFFSGEGTFLLICSC